ncbi:hypothetical protein [Limnohabitans sp. TEGF004]|uniref:hypothetical protein n=1 Tax=Limnohabitans sp. TEGF004 TaxID=2986281 RepID=UPI0023779059|nr:hypothetical protein [Limnohabitans sp. TEGF004]BDU55135.1 hypothetical protein LTEGF4_08160 [Limnohabitans sp. TEGF004]
MSLMHDMIDFFKRYQSEFDQQNWASFAALFHEPAMSVRADGSVMVIPTHADGARLYASVSSAWRAEGYERFETENFEVLAQGQDSRLVSFDWLMLSNEGELIRRWRQSYQVIRTKDDWQVFTSTFHKP